MEVNATIGLTCCKFNNFSIWEMSELDLKSEAPKGAWGFDSPSRHQARFSAPGTTHSACLCCFYSAANLTVCRQCHQRIEVSLSI
jgi:hypothetical protein